MQIKQVLILSIVYLVISFVLVFMLVRLGKIEHGINQLSLDFNKNQVFVYLPTEDQIEYVNSHYDKSYSLYGLTEEMIEGNLNYVYQIYTTHDLILYMPENRWVAYRNPGIKPIINTIYSSGLAVKGATPNEITHTKIVDNEVESSFLYKKVKHEDFSIDRLYLIVFDVETQVFNDYVQKYGYPDIIMPYASDSFYVFGQAIFVEKTSNIKEILNFMFIIHFIPLILIVFLLKYTYEVFLSSTIKDIQTKYIFYQSKKSIFLWIFINNIVFFLGVYSIIAVFYGLFFQIYLEVIKYIVISCVALSVVILISSYEIVNKALNKVFQKVV